MPHPVGPGDISEHSIEWDPDGEDEREDIADETQLEKFIQALQTAQLFAHKQEKEKVNATKRPKTYTKNAPRTMRRRQEVRSKYQAAGGKLITEWFGRKEASPPVHTLPITLKDRILTQPQVNEFENVQGGTHHKTFSGGNTEADGIEMGLEGEDLQDHIPDIQVTRPSYIALCNFSNKVYVSVIRTRRE